MLRASTTHHQRSHSVGGLRTHVPWQEAERYRSVVKRPMDLATMYVKLQAGSYSCLGRFKADLERMLVNCERYTQLSNTWHSVPHHAPYAYARHLREYARHLMLEMVSLVTTTSTPQTHTHTHTHTHHVYGHTQPAGP
jgi:hypothetical protein